MLGTGADAVEREGAAVIDFVESTQSKVARDEIAEMSEWLD